MNNMKRFLQPVLVLALLAAPLFWVGCMKDSTYSGGTSGSAGGTIEIPSNEVINAEIFSALDLDYPGLESVKSYYEADQYYLAAKALLEYYRARTEVAHPDVNLLSPTITADEQQIADWALSKNSYRLWIEGSLGSDGAPHSWMKDKAVDWALNPSGEEASRYGVHRHAWFLPQALAYRTSLDETYVKELVALHGDWIAKHPLVREQLAADEAYSSNDYAWRKEEVAGRIADYGSVMLYTMQSVNFTPEWIATFLASLYEQTDWLQAQLFAENSDDSESLRKEMARGIKAVAALFPEMKGAEEWAQKATSVMNEGIDPALFDVLNLDYPEFSAVKAAYEAGDYLTAADRVLDYYRGRTHITNLNVNLNLSSVTADEQLYADYALRENGFRFYVKNYYEDAAAKKPYSFMTEEGTIDWQTMPKSDQELRYQLHRHMWMVPQAKTYFVTKDEKYVAGWMEVLLDWFAQNPRPTMDINFSIWPGNLPADQQNYGWTWRSLDVAARLIDHCTVMEYVKGAESITPIFWLQFLGFVASEADHIMANYSADSNHLITQAQAVSQSGVLLPELKNAEAWLQSGSSVLIDCVESQYYADGWLKDGDFQYHVSSIEDFRSAMLFAQSNGRGDVYPESYKGALRKMIDVVMQMIYPNYSSVNMADTRSTSWTKSVLKKNLNRYVELFPEDQELLWLATEGASGTQPTLDKVAFADCGYYVLRSGWTKNDQMMVLTNTTQSPKEQWHLQWDNMTFELYNKGRHFFPDSGCYSYDTGSNRSRYAATSAHNTLSLGGANMTSCRGEMLRLDYHKASQSNRLVLVNPSYSGLMHRRHIFHTKGSFYVIVDEAYGAADGTLNLNFHPGESEENIVLDSEAMGMHTTFSDGNNIVVRTFTDAASMTFEEREGIYSNKINTEVKRKAYRLNVEKAADAPVRFVTVIYPCSDASTPEISAKFSGSWTADRMAVDVTINGETYNYVNSALAK